MERSKWNLLSEALIPLASIGILIFFVERTVTRLLVSDDREQIDKQKASTLVLEELDRHANNDSEDASDAEDFDDTTSFGEHPKARRRKYTDINLTKWEQSIATDVVLAKDIPVSFSDIGGLNSVVEELREAVISPLMLPELYRQASSLLTAPSGVLFYGPPGCGKTMLAKALAHESGATFINLHIESLTEKWFGESNKLCAAVFSLARKLQPCIVFIDEIDAILGTRKGFDHETSTQMKAEFMTHWDGLTSADKKGRSQGIVILGATNRVEDIDPAILRRMPKKFCVPLPSGSQRSRIFSLILKDTKLDSHDFDLEHLVRVSEGMSGSDIKEACRDAAMIPFREVMRGRQHRNDRLAQFSPDEIRGLRTDDFFEAIGGITVNIDPRT